MSDDDEEMKAADSDGENMFDDLDGANDRKKQVIDGSRKRRDVPAGSDDKEKKFKNKGKVSDSKMANKRAYKEAKKKIKANKLKGKGL